MKAQPIARFNEQPRHQFAINCYLNSNRNDLEQNPLWDFKINNQFSKYVNGNQSRHQEKMIRANTVQTRPTTKRINTTEIKRHKTRNSNFFTKCLEEKGHTTLLTTKIENELSELSKHKSCVKHKKPFQKYYRRPPSPNNISLLGSQIRAQTKEEKISSEWVKYSQCKPPKLERLSKEPYDDPWLNYFAVFRGDPIMLKQKDMILFNRPTKSHDFNKSFGDSVSFNSFY